MITFGLKLIIITASTALLTISNPVKMSMILLGISISLFIFMAISSGGSWFPTLFVLLFLGGILMMFMILSSILPNEKSLKIKLFLTSLTLAYPFWVNAQKFSESNDSFSHMKSMLNTSATFNFLIVILILYFFSVISMLCKEENPMRMVVCCKKKLIL